MVRWKGKLFGWKLLLLIIFGGWLFFHFADIFETFFYTGSFDFWYIKLFTSLEPRMVENPGLITKWVDSYEEPLRYGSTYIDALISLVPSQLLSSRVVPLSEWLIWKLYGMSHIEAGSGFTFGSVAEGYLNGKTMGVIFQGLLIGLVGAFIRYFKSNKRLIFIGPLFYSGFILITYKLLRTDSVGIIKRLQWGSITIFVLVALFYLVYQVSGRKQIQKAT